MDTPHSLDQPSEAGTPEIPNGYSTPTTRIAALAIHLGTRGLNVDVNQEGLIARDPDRPGTIRAVTCHPRPDDAHRLWFFTADAPIAEADRVFDAAVAIRALFTSGETGGERG